MTLTRLVLAWIPVAIWFVIVARAAPVLVAVVSKQAAQPAAAAAAVPELAWHLVESLVLTLFASLWFDSLGHGGWWLVFLLVGILATVPGWRAGYARAELARNAAVVGACADLVRYLVAGAILAWRLG